VEPAALALAIGERLRVWGRVEKTPQMKETNQKPKEPDMVERVSVRRPSCLRMVAL
jgi:hypothetical protein